MNTLMGILMIAMSVFGNHGEFYVQAFTVCDLEPEAVVIESNDGNQFAFRGEGFKIGDAVCVLMDDNNTPYDVTDDSIISVW